jgi:hypothetical protein
MIAGLLAIGLGRNVSEDRHGGTLVRNLPFELPSIPIP